MDSKLKKLIFKTMIFAVSISISWWMIKSGFLDNFIDKIILFRFLAEFISGMLYTFFLTTPIAIAMFLVIAQDTNPIVVALLGGLGGACADFLIVRFFRDNSKDLNQASKLLKIQKIYRIFKLLRIEFLVPIFGALIIASPFPDEIGLLMLGASGLKYHQLFLVTYILDTVGILLIVVPINLLS